jgi:hypothetical protein
MPFCSRWVGSGSTISTHFVLHPAEFAQKSSTAFLMGHTAAGKRRGEFTQEKNRWTE